MKQWCIVLLSFLLASFYLTTHAQQGTVGWARNVSSTRADQANSVAYDNAGNVYLTGSFSGTGVSFGNTVPTQSSAGNEDIYLVKYNASGVAQWVTTAGGSSSLNSDRGQAVAVDNAGNVYVAGQFGGLAQFQTQSINSKGEEDAFIAKYNSAGVLQFVRTFGGVQRDQLFGVTVDAQGNIYATGQFQSSITMGTKTFTSAGDFDAIVCKWDANGNFIWANTLGSAGTDQGWDVEVTGGSLYLSGFFNNTANWLSANANGSLTSQGNTDAFVARLDAQNGAVTWARREGGVNADYAHGLDVDGNANVYVVGRFAGSVNFAGVQARSSNNQSDDGFVAKYDANGNFSWVQTAGGSLSDYAYSVVVGSNNNVYVVGQYQGAFNYLNGSNSAFNLSSKGSYDVYLARYDVNGVALSVQGFGSLAQDVAKSIDELNNQVVFAGLYNNTLDFGGPSLTLQNSGQSDGFVTMATFGSAPDCASQTPTTPFIIPSAPANCSQLLTADTRGVNATGFVWWFNGNVIPGATTSTFNATASGAYQVQYMVGSCTSTASATTQVNINTSFSVFAGSDVSINAGQSATLNASASGNTGNVTFVWSTGATGSSITVSPNSTSDFTVTGTDGAGCVRSDVVRVVVQTSTPTCQITAIRDNVQSTPAVAEICEGQASGFISNDLLNNANFTFSWRRNGVEINTGGPRIEPIHDNGLYQLFATSRIDGSVCTSNIIEVKSFPIPFVTITPSNQGNPCTAGSVTLTANAVPGQVGTPFAPGTPGTIDGYKFLWVPQSGIIGGTVNSRSITVQPAAATDYIVTLSDSIKCGNSSPAFRVNAASPAITLVPAGPVCAGAILNAVRTDGGSLNGITVTWTRNGVVISSGSGLSFITATIAGTYQASIPSTTQGCPAQVTNLVTVLDAPTADAGIDRSICAGNSTTLGPNSTNNNLTYSWIGSDGSSFNVSRPTVRPAFTTSYTLTVSISNNSCPAVSDVVVVNVQQLQPLKRLMA